MASTLPQPAGAAGSTPCPKCGQPVPAGSRFCNACGASLPTPAPSASGAPAAVDIRQSVDDNRGFLKRLQLLIPGYRGYREGEDARAADNLLRIQVADKLKNARGTLENARQAMSNAGMFAGLMDLAPLIADLQRLEGEIRHAEQGYTGISPSLRINPQQIDRLYEYDYGFALAGDQLSQTVAGVPDMAMSNNAAGVQGAVATARTQISQLETAFKARIQVIEGIRIS